MSRGVGGRRVRGIKKRRHMTPEHLFAAQGCSWVRVSYWHTLLSDEIVTVVGNYAWS